MNSKEIIKKVLEEWHFPVLHESDNIIVFRYQMNYIQIDSMFDNSTSMAVTLRGLFSADSETKATLALRAANDVNYQLLQTKAYLNDENELVIASEFFYSSENDVEYLLKFALQGVLKAKKHFQSRYEAFESEYELMRELDEE